MTGRDERLGSAREEAERLVAAGLGWASAALHGAEADRQLGVLAEQMFDPDRVHDLAAGLAGFVSGVTPGGSDSSGPGVSTGSADCCVCPVCKAIAALRHPTPEFAERLASAVGDVAVGISGLLRTLSSAVPRPGHHTADDPWHAATTTPPAGTATTTPPAGTDATPSAGTAGSAPEAPGPAAPSRETGSAEAAPPKRVAKKAVAKKAVAKKAVAKKAVAKKAVAKKAVAKKTVAKKTAAEQVAGPAAAEPAVAKKAAKKATTQKTAAQKAVAKKATAKKAVRKAVPRDLDDGPA